MCPGMISNWVGLAAHARFHQMPISQFAKVIEQLCAADAKARGIRLAPLTPRSAQRRLGL